MLTTVALLLAFAAPAQTAPERGPSVDPSIADGSAQRALDSARRTWRRDRPRSYTYRLQLGCFCTREATRPHTFVVRNGRPVHPPKGHRGDATGGRLFKLVQYAIDHKVDGLRVDYHLNGLLKELDVDQYSGAVDDEYAFFVDRFRRLR
jgi:hypothetical protein